MNKNLLLILAAAASLTASADLGQAGYYRVQNYGSQRWIEVVDNEGKINYGSTNADTHAIELQKQWNEVVSDPASVLYISNISGNTYNVSAQGTSIYDIIEHNVQIRQDGTDSNGEKLYRCYGVMAGQTRYLGDGNDLKNADLGELVISASGDYVKWYIKPINATSDNYFGADLDVNANGKYYTTLFTTFPYAPTTSKVYYIGRVDHGMAEMIEVTGTIAPNTPVIIEGSAAEAGSNRMTIGGEGTSPRDNSLKGRIFDYGKNGKKNYLTYDPATMRVLGKCADGSLGFVTSSTLTTIPANSAYITVPAGSPAEYKCVTTAEFEAYDPGPQALYVVGSFNDWATPGSADTYITLARTADGVYSGTLKASEVGELKFKVFDSITTDWANAYGADINSGVTLEAGKTYTWQMRYGENAYDFIVANWGGTTGTLTLNLNSNTATLVTDNVYTGPVYPENLWLVGSFNEWNTTEGTYEMVNLGDGLYQGEFNIPAGEGENGLEFKFTADADWTLNYGATGSEIYSFSLYSDNDINSPVVKNGSNWAISNWQGGTLVLKLDLEAMTLDIEGPQQPKDPAHDIIYLIGDMNDWNFNSTAYPLYPDGNAYTGSFNIPDGKYYFRFYSQLGGEQEYSIGSSESMATNVPVVFEGIGTFTAPVVMGGEGCWVLEDWNGGAMRMTVDPVALTLVVYAPGADVKTIAADGSLRFANGVVTTANPTVITVTDAAGKTVAREYASSINLNQLPKGVYIVTADGKTIKVAR